MSSASPQIAGSIARVPAAPAAGAPVVPVVKGGVKTVPDADTANPAIFATLVAAAGAKPVNAEQEQSAAAQDGTMQGKNTSALLSGTLFIASVPPQTTPQPVATVNIQDASNTGVQLTPNTATQGAAGLFDHAPGQSGSDPTLKGGAQKAPAQSVLVQGSQNQPDIKGITVAGLSEGADQTVLLARAAQPKTAPSAQTTAQILKGMGQANSGVIPGNTRNASFLASAKGAVIKAARGHRTGTSVAGKKTSGVTSSPAQAKGAAGAPPANAQALVNAARAQGAGAAPPPVDAAALSVKQNGASAVPAPAFAMPPGIGSQSDGLITDAGTSGSIAGSSFDQNGHSISKAQNLPSHQGAGQANHAPRLDAAALAQFSSRLAQRAQNGNMRFEMRLDPPELGRVKVRIDVHSDNRVEAVLSSHRPDVLADLQKGADGLRRALIDQGFDLDQNGLSFSLDHSGAQNGHDHQGGPASSFSSAPSADQVNADPVTTARIALGYGLDRVADGRVDIHI